MASLSYATALDAAATGCHSKRFVRVRSTTKHHRKYFQESIIYELKVCLNLYTYRAVHALLCIALRVALPVTEIAYTGEN